MKIMPYITEKTTAQAKKGKFTFVMASGLNKSQAKEMINKLYSVHVRTINVVSAKQNESRSLQGKKKVKPAYKKATVTLREKEKIEAFEEKK